MVLVPAGEFQMGGGSEPVRTVDLEAFYIDRFEVTNARFARFVEATGYKVQGAWARYATPDRADHPAIAVSWFDADAYCRWAGGRLPREEEWEKAARGGDARLYPWGNRWDPLRLNSLEMGPGATTPVGAYPGGASPYGVEDMAGNVWEWTDSWLGGSAVELLRVVRGGSRSDPEEMCRTYARRGIYPEAGTLVNSGFRCVVDPEP
jgi:serine/threonine-protein kinase